MAEPTYRATMLPIGTYANPDGTESLGWAMPGMIQEPINALMRLAENSRLPDGRLGIPNPQNPQNQQDVVTGLLSLYGGNAMNPLAAVPKGALASNAFKEAAPIRVYRGTSETKPIDALRDRYWASTSPDVAASYARPIFGSDNPSVTPADVRFQNPMTVDAGGSFWAQIPHNGGTTTTDHLATLAQRNGHDGLIVKNVYDGGGMQGPPADTVLALKHGTVTSPLTGETLFSDTGLPSIWGSALAPYQEEPRNALLTY